MYYHIKKSCRVICIAMLFLFNLCSEIEAQETRTLSLQDALDIALGKSRMLSIGKEKIKAADARVDEVQASMLPALKFQTGYTRLSQVPPFTFTLPFPGSTPITISPVILDNYVMKLSAAQPVFTGFKLENLEKSAELAAKAVKSDYDKDKNELIAMIKTQYWGYVKAQQFVKVAKENVEILKAHLKDVETLNKAGMAQVNDILKLQVQVSEAEYRLLEANNQKQLAMMGLNNALRLPLTTNLETTENPTLSMIEKPVDIMIDEAIEFRPDIKASEFRIKASESQVKVAEASWYPQVSVFAEYNYNNPNMRIVPARSQFDDTWAAGIQLSMDVWNWGLNTSQTQQAEAQLAQAMDADMLTKESIQIEVMQAYTLMKQASDKIPVTETSIKQAEEQVRTINLRYNNGNAIMTDVLDAETALLMAKMNKVQAIIDLEIAKVKLEKSIGHSL
jgi:outer membrane protein